ncbi:MAG: ATP synthase F1 subunit epsilon [Tissierellia bacterium]|nr:ATP synthase F1 subunit epsilon [Tissierellia bacterium]
MKAFQVDILSADQVFYRGPALHLSLPTSQGLYGILARHVNMVLPLVPGLLTYRTPDGKNHQAAISQGVAKLEGGQVLVLVDTCESPENIDAARAKRAQEEAQRALRDKASRRQHQLAEAKLSRALNRLQVREKYDKETGL